MVQKQGYSEPPWKFTGRAIYQLQLVKLEEAKKYIPPDLHIVNFFGYSLGGFYLAKYDDSPAGPFEECVAIAGIVWNKPTSCAWAARVYVNNRDARDHGRQHVGLPSRVCNFSSPETSRNGRSWWQIPLSGPSERNEAASLPSKVGVKIPETEVVMRNVEKKPKWRPWRRAATDESIDTPLCTFSRFPTGVGRAGPRIKLSLPSFSGRTAESPNMLQYACHLATNVRLVQPLAISFDRSHETNSEARNGSLEELRGVMGGRPVLALAFDKMEMIVHQPLPVPEKLPSVMWQVQETDPCPQLVGSR